MAAMRDVGALETRIKAAPDADALRAIVAELGVVHGSQGKLYTSEELLEHIETALRVPEPTLSAMSTRCRPTATASPGPTLRLVPRSTWLLS